MKLVVFPAMDDAWGRRVAAGGAHAPQLAAHPAVLTNMRGVYGDMVPEHAFALVLALARGMHRYAWMQRERMWLKQEIVILAGTTMGVVGLGSIGQRGHHAARRHRDARARRPLARRPRRQRRALHPRRVSAQRRRHAALVLRR
ncbi:MAG: NAD(P)-dependent oxidoreductase [Candidatus Rokuibacteriota bacterium]